MAPASPPAETRPGGRRLVHFVPVLLFVVLVAYFARELGSGRDPHALPSVLIDKPAPAFALAGLDGGTPLTRDALAGQVVLVNFFASWCVPCRGEHPLLERLAEQEHVPIYGIAYRNKPGDAQQFIAQLGNPYRGIGVDEKGRVGIDFGITGVPETFVLDKTGTIRRHYGAPLDAATVKDDLLPLLRALNAS
jgi:cytochrome c biogenesis protein CcmG, thiol:disulfide interchange protein DsbE